MLNRELAQKGEKGRKDNGVYFLTRRVGKGKEVFSKGGPWQRRNTMAHVKEENEGKEALHSLKPLRKVQ